MLALDGLASRKESREGHIVPYEACERCACESSPRALRVPLVTIRGKLPLVTWHTNSTTCGTL